MIAMLNAMAVTDNLTMVFEKVRLGLKVMRLAM